jgi:hypothetical protein
MKDVLIKFEEQLKNVDWFYMMIDDWKRYKKEKDIYDAAKAKYENLLSENVEGVKELWDSYDPYSK